MDLHFVVQKEQSRLDTWLTKLGIAGATTYVVHSYQTFQELKVFFPSQHFQLTEDGKRSKGDGIVVIKLYHPIYELFQPRGDLAVDAFKKKLHLKKHVFLFFGFIRKYKGLHNVIKAFKLVADTRNDVSLLICGESFWDTLNSKKFLTKLKKLGFSLTKFLFLKRKDDERNYNPLNLIEALGLQDVVTVVNKFIPNEDVYQYFQVSNCTVLYYTAATSSGIESLSYHFGLPILATKVGHFTETVQEGVNGYLAEPEDVLSMAQTMLKLLEHPIPCKKVKEAAKQLSWQRYAEAILAASI